MKFIKVSVPDDFDPETHQIFLHSPFVIKAYPDIPDWKKTQIDVWKPIYHDVLDHGFIGLIDFMGDDDAVAQAARVSYGSGTRRVSADKHLIRYLIRNRHWTPIEMVEIKWHVKAPIFVFRQWHRHRAASINEYSGRYSVMSDDMYMPNACALKPQSDANKQGRDGALSETNAHACQLQIQHAYEDAKQAYHYLLGDAPTPNASLNQRLLFIEQFAVQQIKRLEATDSDWAPEKVTEGMVEAKIAEIIEANGLAFTDDEFRQQGLTRELARIVLPVATYSEMYWKSNLRNTLNFISLRSDPHAQEEIRVYSDLMLKMIEPIAPICIAAFIDYDMKAKNFSAFELDVVRHMYQRMNDDSFDTVVEEMMVQRGASKREIKDFINTLQRNDNGLVS